MRLKYSLITVTILIREKIAENTAELVLDQRVTILIREKIAENIAELVLDQSDNPDKTEI